MSLLPLADCARLLGIHPKTLRSWLKQDALEMSTHPRDARVKCLTLSQVSHLADLHDRPLSEEINPHPAIPEAEQPRKPNEDLSLPKKEADALVDDEASSLPATPQDETSLLAQLASLNAQVTTLTEQVAQLALALLAAQDRSLDHRLTVIETALQEVVGKPLALSSPPMGESLSGRGKRPLNQAEERVRSRRPPLIEYSAQGTYVIVSMQEGELDVEPDEEE